MTAPRVFVSRAAALGPAERAIAGRWSDALNELDLAPIALTREDYQVPPWTQLRALVSSCDGLVVLGFRARPTPWSHVEAGLAIMGGLPILVAAEDGLSEAVFEPQAWGQGVSGVSLHVWDGPEPLADPALQGWLSSVRSSR
jgi:hypothetical protein